MSDTIRRFHVSDALAAVAQVEAALGLPAAKSEHRFHRFGIWLLEGRYLARCIAGGGDASEGRRVGVPAFARESRLARIAALARDFRPATRARGRCVAQALCFKKNLRAFHLEGAAPTTVKLAWPDPTTAAQLAVERRIRESLPPIEGLRIPRILRVELDGAVPFLSEEVLFGRRLRPAENADRITELLFELYHSRGVRHAPPREWLGPDAGAQSLEAACTRQGWRREWGEESVFLEAWDSLLSGPGEIPGVAGHGDLGFSNFLGQADGSIAVLDWEDARDTSLVADLLRVALASPAAMARLEAEINALPAPADGAPLLGFRAQLAAALVEYILDRSGKPGIDDLSPYFARAASMLADPSLCEPSAPGSTR